MRPRRHIQLNNEGRQVKLETNQPPLSPSVPKPVKIPPKEPPKKLDEVVPLNAKDMVSAVQSAWKKHTDEVVKNPKAVKRPGGAMGPDEYTAWVMQQMANGGKAEANTKTPEAGKIQQPITINLALLDGGTVCTMFPLPGLALHFQRKSPVLIQCCDEYDNTIGSMSLVPETSIWKVSYKNFWFLVNFERFEISKPITEVD